MTQDKQSDDSFFIGWLPMPKRDSRFLVPMGGLCIVGCLLVGLVLVGFQKDPGSGEWETGQVITLRGLAVANPYAMLHVADDENTEKENGESDRTFLLVEQGKFGALPRVRELVQGNSNGVPVEARGTLLHRDDRWMLELESGDVGLRVLEQTSAADIRSIPSPVRVIAELVVLQGEVIDPKCYLGAMKPGGGKTHKACAMRCISGGIPPMLVTRDAMKRETFYLLVDEDGGTANDAVYSFVGDLVQIQGRLEEQAGMNRLVLSRDSIRRL